jgi:hypothetical protein
MQPEIEKATPRKIIQAACIHGRDRRRLPHRRAQGCAGAGGKIMEDLFRSYWWLLFPLAWMIIGGCRGWLDYQRRRDNLDLIKHFADSGKDIPAGLIEKLGGRARTGG